MNLLTVYVHRYRFITSAGTNQGAEMNANEIRETVRQMLTDWNAMTSEQQAEALEAVAA